MFTPAGPRDFERLAPAIQLAQDLAGAEAESRALQAGAAEATISFSQQDNNVNNDIDGNMFFEALVTATASGPPVVKSY